MKSNVLLKKEYLEYEINTEYLEMSVEIPVDEFKNFATDAFESILSEARKFKLGLTVANQYIKQLSEKIKNAFCIKLLRSSLNSCAVIAC